MFEQRQPHHRFRTITVRWRDGLQFSSGFTHSAKSFSCVFLLYPLVALLPGDAVANETIDRIWEYLFGLNWQQGNEDGSRYAILSGPEVNYPDRSFTVGIASTGILQQPNQQPDNLWFLEMDHEGRIAKLSPAHFRAQLKDCQFPAGIAESPAEPH